MKRPAHALPPTLWLGATLTALFAASALLSLLSTPTEIPISVIARLQACSLHHPLGTDQLGRDLLTMILRAGATSLSVALLSVALGALVGTALGLWAAARQGWVDELIMRGNDIVFAFPALLLAILIAAAFGPGALNAILAIGLFSVPVFARIVRAEALGLWVREFVLSAQASGKSRLRISAEHILPNLAGALIVQVAIQLSLAIIAETSLSYVGLGTQPPQPSWGRMLSDAQSLSALAPTLALYPGLAVVAAVLGFQLLGDGLREALLVQTQNSPTRS